MKKIFVAIVVFLVIVAALTRYNSSSRIILLNLLSQRSIIKPGELNYRITFLNILPIGRATLTGPKDKDYNGKKAYYLEAHAQTRQYFAKLFSASADISTYIDKGDNNPLSFKQTLRVSGKPDVNKEVSYDQINGIMTIDGVGRTILPNTQDPLSVFFNLQKMDFEKIHVFEMNINTNQKNYVLNAKVTPQDISINRKIYRTYILKAVIKRRDKNNPYHRSKITMIMLKNEVNIPISVKVFASGALINAKLVEIK